MSFENIVLIISGVISFFLSFAGFLFLNNRKNTFGTKQIPPFVVILAVFTLSSLSLSYFFYQDNDFIFDFSALELPILLASSAFVFFISQRFSLRWRALTIFALATLLCLLLPGTFSFSPKLPAFVNLPLLIIAWFLFSFFYRFLNGIESVLALQSLSICVGIFLLALVSALPNLLGALGLNLALIIFAFLIFNRYPARLELSDAGATALGFLLGGLVFRSVYEGVGPCMLILSMFFIVEIVSSLFKTLFLSEEYADITSNTFYFQANISGLSPENVASNLLRLQIVLLVLAYFQAFAPNSFSVPGLSLVITAWYLNKLKNWQTANQSLKEINRDVINEIKNNIEDIKESIKKDKP